MTWESQKVYFDKSGVKYRFTSKKHTWFMEFTADNFKQHVCWEQWGAPSEVLRHTDRFSENVVKAWLQIYGDYHVKKS